MTLNRLPRRQAAELTGWVAHGKALPPEVVEQVVAKTDGVPLFVEELTKMVLESGLREREARYELTGPLPSLAIPATLHDSLMARLDRLAAVKALAQLGPPWGASLPWIAAGCLPLGRGDLATGAAPVGGGGVPLPAGSPAASDVPLQACLIQDAAYQSLLKHPAAVSPAHRPGAGGAFS